MCSKVNWWNDERISWYERASEYSQFHSILASILSQSIRKKDKVIEAGSGLGYLTNALYTKGIKNIKGYDIDEKAIAFASSHFDSNLFELKDIFTENEMCDVLVCVFFGKLSRNNNFESFSRIARRKIIYVTGGGSARHVPPEEIMDYLDSVDADYTIRPMTIPFNQPFVDEEEAELFLQSYYKDDIRNEKRKCLRLCPIPGYPIMLKNKKDITIFEIEMGDNK